MPTVYKIISEGFPCEGKDKKEVIMRIAKRFKMDVDKASRLVSGKAIVLKSGLNHSTMQKYSQTLKSLGLQFKVEASKTEDQSINYQKTTNSFACPKCGHQNHGDINAPGASCSSCGVIYKKITTKTNVPDHFDQTTEKDEKTDIEVQTHSNQRGIEDIKRLYHNLPKSIKIFWRLMVVFYAIALLRAIFEGGVGMFLAVAIGAAGVWFLIPYYCMRTKGFWPWVFTIVWTFPIGLILLSEPAKAYFLSNDS